MKKFKKINNNGSELIEITIRDGTGGTIQKWKAMISDFPKIYTAIRQKYNIPNNNSNDFKWLN